mgnify:FL=1
MKPKRTPRPALPPPGLRPKLRRDQLRDLALCHLEALDSIARGDATSATLWDFAGAALTWSKAAELMGIGEAEMTAQLELALSLIERYKRTGRVLFTGREYQDAKDGVAVMEQLAEIVDHPRAVIAAEWSERRLQAIEAQSRARAAA